MNNLTHYLLPTGIIASVSSTMVENPMMSAIGEKAGMICLMGYFLWDKTRECRGLKEENKLLTERLIEQAEHYATGAAWRDELHE